MNKIPKKIYGRLKQRMKYGLRFSLSEFVLWHNEQDKICYYCRLPEKDLKNVDDKFNGRTSILSIDRLDSNVTYTLNNIVLACLRCNSIKSNIFSAREMRKIGMMFIKPKWDSRRDIKTFKTIVRYFEYGDTKYWELFLKYFISYDKNYKKHNCKLLTIGRLK